MFILYFIEHIIFSIFFGSIGWYHMMGASSSDRFFGFLLGCFVGWIISVFISRGSRLFYEQRKLIEEAKKEEFGFPSGARVPSGIDDES